MEWLEETEGKTVFKGDVLRLQKRQVASGPRGERMWDSYDVTRGGWNFDPGPDTWLTEHVLARSNGRLFASPLRISAPVGTSPIRSQGSSAE